MFRDSGLLFGPPCIYLFFFSTANCIQHD